ncbi:MAG: hypothetical protein WD081_03935 [Gammaproteobacteria bacterium]
MKAKILIFLALVAIAATAARAHERENADRFLDELSAHCGEAYAGRVVTNEPVTGPDPFANRYLVMYVADCTPEQIRLTFHVSDDGEREWILRRTERGLQLRHAHRAENGLPLALTMYGGETVNDGTPLRQEFPADGYTIALFERENLDVGRDNIWAMEIEPDERFLYQLARDDGRLLQIEFDLADPVDIPETALTLAARRAADDWEN